MDSSVCGEILVVDLPVVANTLVGDLHVGLHVLVNTPVQDGLPVADSALVAD